MERYYDLVMAYTINKYTNKEKCKELLGLAPKGANEAERWRVAKETFSGSNFGVISEWGLIDFDPKEKTKLVNGEKLTYDDYLDLMKISGHSVRNDFLKCYYDAGNYFLREGLIR